MLVFKQLFTFLKHALPLENEWVTNIAYG
jgi:hypothetical protein